MTIQVLKTITVAEVEVNDDCAVELRQLHRTTDYTPTQAIRLAEELTEAALQARLAASERDAARVRARQEAGDR